MLTRFSVSPALLLAAAAPLARAEEKVNYETQIQPIFAQHCVGCHGEEKPAAKLTLLSAAKLKEKWTADAHLIVAGDPEKSELYQRLVLPADDKKRMPKKADPLPKETTDLIARWIKEGATLPGEPPTPPAPAPTDKPAEAAAAPAESAKLEPPTVAPAPKDAIDALTAAGAQVMIGRHRRGVGARRRSLELAVSQPVWHRHQRRRPQASRRPQAFGTPLPLANQGQLRRRHGHGKGNTRADREPRL
jgi:mono/diheme cytochrome c family protein